MNLATIDDARIETRFVWARCAAENAHAMRELIRDFQSDGWGLAKVTRKSLRRKKQSRRH